MTDVHVMAPGKPYMAKLVDAGDGSFALRIIPLPEVEELDRLRREVLQLRLQVAVGAFEESVRAFVQYFRLAYQEARLLALLFVNSGKLVDNDAITRALYGHRPDGGPDNIKTARRVHIHAIRNVLPAGSIENEFSRGYRLLEIGHAKCLEARAAVLAAPAAA